MPKKCIVCGKDAEYLMKGTNNYYCNECAIDLFGDVSYLIPISSLSESYWDEEIDQLDTDEEAIIKLH